MTKGEEKHQAKSEVKNSEVKSEHPGSWKTEEPRGISTGYQVPVSGCCVSHLTIVQKLENSKNESAVTI